MTEAQGLQLGDTVVMTRIPPCVVGSSHAVRDGRDGFMRVYQRAVARKSRLTVSFMDSDGRPWVKYRFTNKRGEQEHHAMLIDDDSYERVA